MRHYIHRHRFKKRLLHGFIFSGSLIVVSLGMGVVGYHYLCLQSWIDALLNASMILTGMGPVNDIPTAAGKLFASFYALYSGVAFLTSFAVLFTPFFHRLLHRLNLDVEETQHT